MFDHRLNHRVIPDVTPAVHERSTNKTLGRIGNISSEGILLLTDEEISRGKLLELVIPLPREMRGQTEVEFNAQVMWAKPVETTGQWGCGLAFRHVTQEEMEIFEELIKEYAF